MAFYVTHMYSGVQRSALNICFLIIIFCWKRFWTFLAHFCPFGLSFGTHWDLFTCLRHMHAKICFLSMHCYRFSLYEVQHIGSGACHAVVLTGEISLFFSLLLFHLYFLLFFRLNSTKESLTFTIFYHHYMINTALVTFTFQIK